MLTFEQTWRWFGPHDPISLKEIKQTGATGIVSALHHIPVGTVWTVEEILKRKKIIEDEGLKWLVVESLPVHENIKKRNNNYAQIIENYKESLRNLGKCGIDVVCYNFMPVLDWSRTDLNVVFNDGSITSKFETYVFATFDLFILKRENAEKDYSPEIISKAKKHFESLNDSQKKRLTETILYGLPGSMEALNLDQFKMALKEYDEIGDKELRANLYFFIKGIISTAEEAGIYMTIHADDPPRPLLGLPRVVSNKNDIQQLFDVVDSKHNGLTLCTGSFGADIKNDLVDFAKTFADRINFVHLRNLKRNSDGDFLEDNHLDGEIDLYGVMKVLIDEQIKRTKEGRKDLRMPLRPDHGHLMIPDQNRKGIYPGYSLFGRMRGLAELRGLEMGIRRSLFENEK
jgi:mannonate dehydratase